MTNVSAQSDLVICRTAGASAQPETLNDQTYTFDYTAASQISQRTSTNDLYTWTTPVACKDLHAQRQEPVYDRLRRDVHL